MKTTNIFIYAKELIKYIVDICVQLADEYDIMRHTYEWECDISPIIPFETCDVAYHGVGDYTVYFKEPEIIDGVKHYHIENLSDKIEDFRNDLMDYKEKS